MTIKTLKELEAVMKLCQKHGIRNFKLGNVEMAVDLVQPEATQPKPTSPDNMSNLPKYSDEELMVWSSAGSESM